MGIAQWASAIHLSGEKQGLGTHIQQLSWVQVLFLEGRCVQQALVSYTKPVAITAKCTHLGWEGPGASAAPRASPETRKVLH